MSNVYNLVKLAAIPMIIGLAPFKNDYAGFKPLFRFELSHRIDKRGPVDFAPVKKAGLSKLSFGYLDFNGNIPNSKTVDWNSSMKRVWNKKLHIQNVSPATVSSASSIIDHYVNSSPEKMSIVRHNHILNMDLGKVKNDINWGHLCVDNKLDTAHCWGLVYSAIQIDANALTAYSMTELMPYRNGEQNYIMMNLYMKEGGRNFLDNIPSLGDTLLSMGRYQFTSYAVGFDKDGLRPANKISKYSRHHKLPTSVIKLQGLTSDRAAYYFSTYNIMSLIKKMNSDQIIKFNKRCVYQREQMVEYIATAHHNPAYARTHALNWISHGCSKPLISYQGKELKIYSQKTSTNYKAIRHYGV